MSWTSAVGVCNGALGLLGAERITALTDNTEQAELCNEFYETCRDTVNRAYPWNFCTYRKQLTAKLASGDADYPVWGYTNAFRLSTESDDYVLRVLDTENNESYRVEHGILYTDLTTINIRYIRRVTSLTQWNAEAVQALAAHLAMMMAYPITKSQTVFQNMAALYDQLLSDARNTDTQEGTPDEIDSNAIIDARAGYYPYGYRNGWIG